MLDNLSYSIYFNIFFFSILFLGFIFGLIRGYKKSLYAFIVMLGFYACFFLTLDLVVNQLWVISIPGLGSFIGKYIPELSNAASLKQMLPILLETYLGDSLGSTLSNQEFLLFVTNLSLFIVKIVYAILYFTVFQVIYKIIFYFIRIIFFKTDKEKPKRRSLGATFGLLQGAVSVYITLIILGGMMSVSESVIRLTPDNDTIAPVEEVVSAYNQNIVVNATELIKIKDKSINQNVPLNLYLFDSVFSFNYRENNVALRKELAIAADIHNVYINSNYMDTNDLSDITGTEVRTVFRSLSDSDLFTSVLPLAIVVSSDYYDTDISITTEELYAIDWETEVMQLGEIAAITFDLLNAAGVIGDGGTPETVVIDDDTPQVLRLSNNTVKLETVTLKGDDVRALFNSMSDSQLVTLASYVVIEPLLQKSGSKLQAIITVPEDLDWQKEFQALGLVAGAIIDTDVTVDELQSSEPSFMISTLAQLDLTVILESKIVSNALINIITGEANIEGFDMFVVPETVNWHDTYDNDGNLTKSGELRSILLAVNEMSQIADTVDFSNLDLNILSDFNDNTINAIFESKVLTATVSKMITDMDLGTTSLLISDSVYDTNNYIVKSELTSLVKSLRLVLTTLSCDEGDPCETGFDLNKAFALSDAEMDILLASHIIEATIGNLVIDKTGDVLTIPSATLTPVYIDAVPQDIVSKTEIKKLFKGIAALDVTDFDNMIFDASIIQNLSTDENSNVLDQEKADAILDSTIIHATLSTMLIEQSDQSSAVLIVPYEGVENSEIRYNDEIDYISTTEINAVLEAVLALGITDFSTIETLEMTLIIDNIELILNSAILHATLSDQLFSLGDTVVAIPYLDEGANLIRNTVGNTGQETEFIDPNELKNLFDALDLLGLTDINSFDGNIELTTFFDETNRNVLLSSTIMRATISRQILDLGPTTLVVPSHDVSNISVQITVGTNEKETTYIVANEIHAIINSLEILGISNITQFSGSVNLTNLYDEVSQDTLLSSASMHATITKQMKDLGTNVLLVPTEDIDGNEVQTNVSNTDYIHKSEIKSLINALEILEISDITTFTGSFDLVKLADTTDQSTLLESASIHATISQKLFELHDQAVLIVPVYSQDGELEVNRIQKEVSLTTFIVESEIKSLIDAFITMNYTDLDSFGTSIDSSKFFGNHDQLLLSSTIQATLSDKILNDTNGKLIVPNENINTNEPIRIPLTDVTYVELTEMKAILTALDLLNLTDFTAINMDPSNVFNKDFNVLLASASVQATLSDSILANALDDSAAAGSGTLIVPNYYRNDVLAGILSYESIDKIELYAILTSLETLNVTDFNGNMDGSVITNKSDTELTTILNSASFHVTFDNMLQGNTNIQIPDLAKGNFVYMTNTITTTEEIRAFIQATKQFTSGDFTTITFDLNAISNLDATQRGIVLDSMIARNTLTDDLETLASSNPMDPYTLENTDYENDDMTTFLRKSSIINILTHYHMI